jgi:CheY-like chemotaxis protein
VFHGYWTRVCKPVFIADPLGNRAWGFEPGNGTRFAELRQISTKNQMSRGSIKGIFMSQTSLFRRKKILVVEDQADLLELLRLRFKEEGFATATATDGVEAVRKARSLLPDLILLDVMLPELDGFAVCELLQKDASTKNIPIIMVSGLSGQMPRCAGIEAGATDFVTKPVTPANLVVRVRQVFEQRAAAEVAVPA